MKTDWAGLVWYKLYEFLRRKCVVNYCRPGRAGVCAFEVCGIAVAGDACISIIDIKLDLYTLMYARVLKM